MTQALAVEKIVEKLCAFFTPPRSHLILNQKQYKRLNTPVYVMAVWQGQSRNFAFPVDEPMDADILPRTFTLTKSDDLAVFMLGSAAEVLNARVRHLTAFLGHRSPNLHLPADSTLDYLTAAETNNQLDTLEQLGEVEVGLDIHVALPGTMQAPRCFKSVVRAVPLAALFTPAQLAQALQVDQPKLRFREFF
ncbi:MAG: hypothetical protein WEA04_02780 [Candidatus Andersenbacteria bacterium]